MQSCTFMGHSNCSQDVRNSLYKTIERLIICENVNTFYVGTQGQFDRYVYDVLCQLENAYDIDVKVVLAYLNQKARDSYYDTDKTVFPEVLDKTPLRFAISKRNLYMIEQSQYMVCYVNNTFSNSYKFEQRAKCFNLQIINIGNLLI